MTLTREGLKCGIVFILTANSFNDIRYRLSQNFKQKIALQLNREDDYLNIWDGVGKKRPSNIFGRGLVKLDDIYEFQMAKICTAEQWSKYIKETVAKLRENTNIVAKAIPTLPEKVIAKDMINYLKDLSSVPIGVNKKNLDVFTYDFRKNLINIITAKNIDISSEYVLHILEEIKQLSDVNIVVFDAEGVLQTKHKNLVLDYKNFNLLMKNNLNKNKQMLCVIIGVDKFLNVIEDSFEETLQLADNLGNYNFILIDNFTKLKNHEYDSWYKNYSLGDSGIWVGSGIQDQYLINFNSGGERIDNNCRSSFGYVIKQGEPTMIKLLGMEERS